MKLVSKSLADQVYDLVKDEKGGEEMEMTTVAAIATPLVTGGIGVVRISGPQAIEIADRVFRGRRRLSHLSGYEACFGAVYEGETRLDECVALAKSVLLSLARCGHFIECFCFALNCSARLLGNRIGKRDEARAQQAYAE